MAKIGRPSNRAKLKVLNPVIKQRPKPIPGMSRYARVVWKKTVDSHPADHFKPGNLEQLRIYCEAAASHKKAILQIKKMGAIVKQDNGILKRSPWCLERDACAGIVASMATKLQLNPSSTKQVGEAPKPKSRREGLLGGTPPHSQ